MIQLSSSNYESVKFMPFLHLDSRNMHKQAWYSLVKDHPAYFEVLEWSQEADKDLIQRSFPDVDTQLFPQNCIAILASLQKIACYGGITVRGEDVPPNRGIIILLNDWKTLGPPRKLTVKGYSYPVCMGRASIMAGEANDSTCKTYRDGIVKLLQTTKWESPQFKEDVAIM